jgi:hypothetical protein
MERGFRKDATPQQLAKFYDPAQIDAWWRGRFKRAHVGLLTRSLVVVDLDMRKPGTEIKGQYADVQGGTDVLEILMRQAGADWPDTFTVVTPSGGMHLYFLQPDGDPIGCATGDRPTPPHLGPLIDVRGIGGYVIAEGSYSAAQGRAYTRVSAPDMRPQPLPAWLLKLMRPAARPAPARPTPVRHLTLAAGSTRAERAAVAALENVVTRISSLREGDHRNGKLYGAARWLGQLAETAPHILTETAVEDALLGAAAVCGMRHGGQRAALATIRSGWKTGLQQGAGHGVGAA